MTPLEKDIERHLVREIGRRGGLCLKFVCPGWSGVPDRIILLPKGRVIFAEMKRPKGSEVSKLQLEWSNRILARGFDFYFLYTHEDVTALVKSLDRPAYTGKAFRNYFEEDT